MQLEALGGSVRYARDEYQEMQSSRTLLLSADTFLPAVTVPVLALYGEKDSEVDWQESVRIYRDSFARSGNQDLTIRSARSCPSVDSQSDSQGDRRGRTFHLSGDWNPGNSNDEDTGGCR